MKKLSVKISPVAYIGVPHDKFRELMDGLNSWADGAENICITVETLESEIKELYVPTSLKKHLKQAIKEIGDKAGDIVLYPE